MRVHRRIWLAAALLILALHLVDLTVQDIFTFDRAFTPIDRTGSFDPAMFRLLREADDQLPPGSTVTIAAADPEEAFYLYMCAVGILEQSRVLPTHYYTDYLTQHLPVADYVLVFEDNPDARALRTLPPRRKLTDGYLVRVQK